MSNLNFILCLHIIVTDHTYQKKTTSALSLSLSVLVYELSRQLLEDKRLRILLGKEEYNL